MWKYSSKVYEKESLEKLNIFWKNKKYVSKKNHHNRRR